MPSTKGNETLPPSAVDADLGRAPLADQDGGDLGADFPVPDWDRYQFVRRLGQGGMGTVYLAMDRRLRREVALKFIRGDDPGRTMRLLQEARAQARLQHDNICRVYEVGEVEGRAYIAMERLDGPALSEAGAQMTLHQKVEAARDVALALHEAHARGVLHRDVKPANIVVERPSAGVLRPVVMDFGLAREQEDDQGLTETGAVLGTPAYMSPEQARGEARLLDRRSDVYGLGATLYELLCGAPPFRAETTLQTLNQVLHEEPRAPRSHVPSLPEDLETITLKCLAKDPGRRYDSARALADDLDRYTRGEPILGRKPGLSYRLSRALRRHRGLVVTAAVALLAVVIAAGAGIHARVLALRQTAEAEERARVAQEMSRDVQEMEWFMRTAYGLPLHDVEEDAKRLRARMNEIERRMAAYGPWGRAYGHYALGRGHLALHRYDEALDHLRRAVAGGFDTPEVHYGLGVVLGKLYDRGMVEARHRGDKDWVERRRRELAREYLKPAMASLVQSRALRLDSPSYLDGLLAYYRKDHDAALAHARKAEGEARWLYEATQLEAAVHLDRGVALMDRGAYADADRDLLEASRLYDVAAEVGRSDGSLYEGSAEAWIRRMEASMRQGRSPESLLPPVIERLDKARAASPRSSVPDAKLAYTYSFIARFSLSAGQDGRPALAAQLAAANRAAALDEHDLDACSRAAFAHLLQAEFAFYHGADPRGELDATIATSRRCIAIDPRDPQGPNYLGNGYLGRGESGMSIGVDPMSDLRAAIASFEEATRLDEGYLYAYRNALRAYQILARWMVARGLDPRPLAASVDALVKACQKGTSQIETCTLFTGHFVAALAVYEISAGLDHRATAGRALELLERAAARSPDELEFPAGLARLAEPEAEEALASGNDPQEPLSILERAVEACRRVAPESPPCTLHKARLALLQACRPGRGGAPSIEGRGTPAALVSLATLAVERNPRSADALELLADVHRRLAARAVATPDERRRAVDAGLAACDRALALNPNEPRVLAHQGALLLERARALPAPAQPEPAALAHAALTRAVELNPLLGRAYRPLLEEAARRAAPARSPTP